MKSATGNFLWGVRTLNSFTKFALLAYLGLTLAVVPRPAAADDISARLDALEKENAALRAPQPDRNVQDGEAAATSCGDGIENGARPAVAKRGQHGRRSKLQDGSSRGEFAASLTLPPVGIYLATQPHLLSNDTNHGPYVTASWSFW